MAPVELRDIVTENDVQAVMGLRLDLTTRKRGAIGGPA